ncbi:MAG: ABC transporter substrate-binding protein [Bacillota bacterium]|nr:ABC transporter substrate-binding protein [Bacillota bacterium]
MNMIFKVASIFVMSLMMITVVGCSDGKTVESNDVAEEAIDEIRVVDCSEREVVLKSEAKRIVDLTYLEGVRTLIQLGAEDRLVGMSANDHHGFMADGPLKSVYKTAINVAPELKDLPNVGSYKEPNIEKIIDLKPDLIFVLWDKKEYADTLSKQLNVPVMCVGGYGSFNLEMFNAVGKAIGKEDRAVGLIEFTRERIERITDITDNIPTEEKKRIFYWIRTLGDPQTNGRYEAFELAGAMNVAAEGNLIPYGKYKTTIEQVVKWNPDVILRQTATIGDVEGFNTIEIIKENQIIKSVEAIKNNDIFPTKGQMRGYDVATELTEVYYIAKLLYPDEFKDLDVAKEGDEIMKEFYNGDGLYTKMSDELGFYEWE